MLRPQDYFHGPTYDVNKHIAQVRQLHAAYPLKGDEATLDHTLKILGRVAKRVPNIPAEHMVELAAGRITILLKSEQVYDPPFVYRENTENPPIHNRRWLQELGHRAHQDL